MDEKPKSIDDLAEKETAEKKQGESVSSWRARLAILKIGKCVMKGHKGDKYLDYAILQDTNYYREGMCTRCGVLYRRGITRDEMLSLYATGEITKVKYINDEGKAIDMIPKTSTIKEKDGKE